MDTQSAFITSTLIMIVNASIFVYVQYGVFEQTSYIKFNIKKVLAFQFIIKFLTLVFFFSLGLLQKGSSWIVLDSTDPGLTTRLLYTPLLEKQILLIMFALTCNLLLFYTVLICLDMVLMYLIYRVSKDPSDHVLSRDLVKKNYVLMLMCPSYLVMLIQATMSTYLLMLLVFTTCLMVQTGHHFMAGLIGGLFLTLPIYYGFLLLPFLVHIYFVNGKKQTSIFTCGACVSFVIFLLLAYLGGEFNHILHTLFTDVLANSFFNANILAIFRVDFGTVTPVLFPLVCIFLLQGLRRSASIYLFSSLTTVLLVLFVFQVHFNFTLVSVVMPCVLLHYKQDKKKSRLFINYLFACTLMDFWMQLYTFLSNPGVITVPLILDNPILVLARILLLIIFHVFNCYALIGNMSHATRASEVI